MRLGKRSVSLVTAAWLLLLLGASGPAHALPILYGIEFKGDGLNLTGTFTVQDSASGYGVAGAAVAIGSFTIEASGVGVTWTQDDRPVFGGATALNDSSGRIVRLDINYFDTATNWQIELDPQGRWSVFTLVQPTGSYGVLPSQSPVPEPRAILCFLLGLSVVVLFARPRAAA